MKLRRKILNNLLFTLSSRTGISKKIINCKSASKVFFLKKLGADIDESTGICSPFYLENYKPYPIDRLIIGKESYIGSNAIFDIKGGINIGERVTIAYRATITSHIDVGKSNLVDQYPKQNLPVKIENDVYIGANVTILPGITIGNSSIIAAGSVVTKDIPANVLAAGIPAKVIKKIK